MTDKKKIKRITNSNEKELKELEAIKKLLTLSLYYNGVPPLDIAKAAGMSPNELYKYITRTKKRKRPSFANED